MNDIFIRLSEAFLKAIAEDLDQYTTDKSVINIGSDNVTMLTPAHVQFAKYGRGPGKKPPLDPILEWIGDKGIIFEGTNEMGTAFAIQNSIGKKGTKNWVPNAPNAIQEAINNSVGEYTKTLSVEVMEKQSQDVNKAYDKALPTEIKFKA